MMIKKILIYTIVVTSNFVYAKSFKTFDFEGALRVNYENNSEQNTSSSNIKVFQYELGVKLRPKRQIEGEFVFLSEEVGTLSPDVAIITYHQFLHKKLDLNIGFTAIPFGNFGTNFISYPLTQSLFEIKKSFANLVIDFSSFQLNMYAFNGSALVSTGDNIDTFGSTLSLEETDDLFQFNLDLGYITNMLESDTITTKLNGSTTNSKIPGYFLFIATKYKRFGFIAEYISSTTIENEPTLLPKTNSSFTSYQVDLNYQINYRRNKYSILSIGKQATTNASFLGLSESAILIGLKSKIKSETFFNLEYKNSSDYKSKKSNTITAQFELYF